MEPFIKRYQNNQSKLINAITALRAVKDMNASLVEPEGDCDPDGLIDAAMNALKAVIGATEATIEEIKDLEE